jgi:uncharacterized SAM-binding protein YcdF (DUF218 family)
MMEKNVIAAGTISRTVAGFLGGLTALNLAFRLGGSADMNLWWIDLRGWPSWMAGCLLLAVAGLWCALAVRGRCRPWRRWVTLAVTAGSMLTVLGNAWTFFRLCCLGAIGGGFPLPFSLFVFVAVSLIAVGLVWPVRAGKEKYRKLLGAGILGGLIVLLPLGQMLCYGMTDYRRPADAAVILGAGVYADGRVSDALTDRLATGVVLYTQGLVSKLVMSGGPGMGDIHETTAMRQWAIDHGVPAEAILIDPEGLDTTHTAKNMAAMFPKKRLLAVSHAYHLPRVKLAFQAEDVTVYTVPCHESYTLRAMPKYILREIVAIWMYYLL